MKTIELFGKKIPVSFLIVAVILSAAGAGIMASQFAKGPQTFYAVDEASVVQFPNRIENVAQIKVSAIKGEKASNDFREVFRLFHRNNRLVLVDVKLMNTETLARSFDDFQVQIRKQNNDTILAVLTLQDPVDAFTDQDNDAQNGIQFEAKISYSAKNNTFANEIPIIIGAEVTSQ